MEKISRRDRDALRHRQEILAAAEAVFADKGFYGATIEDIAVASEFAIGSLYKHFKSKEAIFKALFEVKTLVFLDTLEETLRQCNDFTTGLDCFLEQYAEFADLNLGFFKIFHNVRDTAGWHSGELKDCVSASIDRYGACVTHLVGQGVQEGRLRNWDVSELAAFFMGAIWGVFSLVGRRPVGGNFKETVPVMRSLLLRGAGVGEFS